MLFLVVAYCGASVAENCTYFESAGDETGYPNCRFILFTSLISFCPEQYMIYDPNSIGRLFRFYVVA